MFPLSLAAAAADLLCDEWTLTTLTTLTTTTMEPIEATLWRRSSSADEDPLSPNDDDDDDDDDGKKGGIAYRLSLVEALKPNGTHMFAFFSTKRTTTKKNNAARKWSMRRRARARIEGTWDVQVIASKKRTATARGKRRICDRDETGVGTRREVSTEQEKRTTTITPPLLWRKEYKKRKMDGRSTVTATTMMTTTRLSMKTRCSRNEIKNDRRTLTPRMSTDEETVQRLHVRTKRSRRGERKQQRECGGENGFENDPNDMTLKSACGNCALGEQFDAPGVRI